jgi:hypothetical protein
MNQSTTELKYVRTFSIKVEDKEIEGRIVVNDRDMAESFDAFLSKFPEAAIINVEREVQ